MTGDSRKGGQVHFETGGGGGAGDGKMKVEEGERDTVEFQLVEEKPSPVGTGDKI